MSVEDKLAEVIGQIQGLAQPAAEIAAGAARASAIGSLIEGTLAVALTWLAVNRVIWALKKLEETDEETYIPVLIACGILGLGFGINACAQLLDVWNWIGAINPLFYLAHVVLKL